MSVRRESKEEEESKTTESKPAAPTSAAPLSGWARFKDHYAMSSDPNDTRFAMLYFGAAALLVGTQGEALWASLEAAMGWDAAALLLVAYIPFAVYWVESLLFYLLPVLAPAYARAHKLQPKHEVDLNPLVYWKDAWLPIFNLATISYPIALLGIKVLFPWRSGGERPPFPTVFGMFFEFLVFFLVEELGFYYFHRAMHHPSVYRFFHKLHHTYTSPVAYTAVYAHPVEHFLVNTVPLVAGPLLTNAHPVTSGIYFVLAIVNTVNTHSGFRLPLLTSASYHDWHHERVTENFGVLGLLDAAHNTMGKFAELEHVRRDREREAEAKEVVREAKDASKKHA